MKTLKLAFVALALSTAAVSASAQWNPCCNRGIDNTSLGIGLIIGTLGTALIHQSQQPVLVQPQTVFVQPAPVFIQPPVIFLQDGTRLTYSHQSGLWVDSMNRAYSLPR